MGEKENLHPCSQSQGRPLLPARVGCLHSQPHPHVAMCLPTVPLCKPLRVSSHCTTSGCSVSAWKNPGAAVTSLWLDGTRSGAAGVGCASAAAVSIACLQGCKYFTSEKTCSLKRPLSPGGTASSAVFGLFISAFSEPLSAAEQQGSASRAGAQAPHRAAPGNSSPAQPGAKP